MVLAKQFTTRSTTTVVTADDWGFSPGVNDAILELATDSVVTGVALTPNMPFFEHRLDELLRLTEQQPQLRISFHLNLTTGKPLTPGKSLVGSSGSFYSVSLFLPRFVLGCYHYEDIAAEIQGQWARLQSAGFRCEHLASHQHCHLAPGFMSTFGPLLQDLGLVSARLPWDFSLLQTSRIPLMGLSAWLRMTYSPKDNGLYLERSVYPLGSDFSSAQSFQAKVHGAAAPEVFVHPALADDFELYQIPDPYRAGRLTEYQCLKLLAGGV